MTRQISFLTKKRVLYRKITPYWATRTLKHGVKVTERKYQLKPVQKNPALETFAAIAHAQWEFWTKQLAKSEKISPTRLERWKKLWRSYAKLTEIQKEDDRIWARKYLDATVRMRINGEI